MPKDWRTWGFVLSQLNGFETSCDMAVSPQKFNEAC